MGQCLIPCRKLNSAGWKDFPPCEDLMVTRSNAKEQRCHLATQFERGSPSPQCCKELWPLQVWSSLELQVVLYMCISFMYLYAHLLHNYEHIHVFLHVLACMRGCNSGGPQSIHGVLWVPPACLLLRSPGRISAWVTEPPATGKHKKFTTVGNWQRATSPPSSEFLS